MSTHPKHIAIEVSGSGQGLYDVTAQVRDAVKSTQVQAGLAHVFMQHTSASLTIQENADPRVLRDMEQFINQLVPEDPSLYTHNEEGPDDMPAHIKSALTQTHLTIPVMDGDLALGTWQGIFVWEHRHARPERQLVVSVQPF